MTVERTLLWLRKFEMLTSDAAKLIHIQGLLNQAAISNGDDQLLHNESNDIQPRQWRLEPTEVPLGMYPLKPGFDNPNSFYKISGSGPLIEIGEWEYRQAMRGVIRDDSQEEMLQSGMGFNSKGEAYFVLLEHAYD